MTSPTKKHIEAAIQILDERFVALLGVDRLGAGVQIIAAALDNAEREGKRLERERCVEIATSYAADNGQTHEFDDDGRWREDTALTIAAAILSEADTSSQAGLDAPAKAGEAGSPPSSTVSPAPYSPWRQNGFNPDRVG